MVTAEERLARANAEAERIRAYEDEWGEEARARRLAEAQAEARSAAAELELQRERLLGDVLAAEEPLDELYAGAFEAMTAFCDAVAKVERARTTYEKAWRKARAAGLDVPVLSPSADVRATRDRQLQPLLVRLRQATLQNGW